MRVHTLKSEARTGHAPAIGTVRVKTERFGWIIEAAASELRRGGQAVTFGNLARYTDMPEFLLRRVVEIDGAARP